MFYYKTGGKHWPSDSWLLVHVIFLLFGIVHVICYLRQQPHWEKQWMETAARAKLCANNYWNSCFKDRDEVWDSNQWVSVLKPTGTSTRRWMSGWISGRMDGYNPFEMCVHTAEKRQGDVFSVCTNVTESLKLWNLLTVKRKTRCILVQYVPWIGILLPLSDTQFYFKKSQYYWVWICGAWL